jgi:hypothetical protein
MLKLMKIGVVLFGLLQISCASPNRSPLKVEYCIVGDTSFICDDPRREELRRSYSLAFPDAKNRVCTKPKDWAHIMERLITCEAMIQE